MADRIVQLVDKNDDNIYPVTTADAPTITVTSTDPGAGSVLAANHFIAVTGSTSSLVGAADLASNAVTTTKIADKAVTADKIDFSTLGENYSTSETDTGFTWIDGKTIYKKTINTGALPNATTKDVSHNITGLGSVIKFEGWAYRSSDGFRLPLPWPSIVNAASTIGLACTSSIVRIETGTNRTAFAESYVTLYYTKN